MSTAVHTDGKPLFTWASIISLILFVMIALQCTSTTAIVIKETGSLKFAIIQLFAFNLVAYLVAVTIYQILA
jgi:ferrous iron transport protein B